MLAEVRKHFLQSRITLKHIHNNLHNSEKGQHANKINTAKTVLNKYSTAEGAENCSRESPKTPTILEYKVCKQQ